jgi:hypothetical protein
MKGGARLLGLSLVAACGSSVTSQPSQDFADGGDATAGDEGGADATIGDGEADDDGGTGDGGCDLGYTPVCCGFAAPTGGYSCEFDFGAPVCGATGWTCPSGGSPAPGCSMLCIESTDAGDGG